MKISANNVQSFEFEQEAFMRLALSLARRGLGNVWPNPAVGCVIVSKGQIVGRGWTMPGGRPHAEVVALKQAGGLARGGEVYVTLEPCCHEGKTGPCAEALVSAGIKKIYISTLDPDPRVNGKGVLFLKKNKISTSVGLLEKEAIRLNLGFFLKISQGRPLVTMKTASTLDGKIALGNGLSKWITNESARGFSHLFRYIHDAVAVGSGTVLADNPELTCRLPGITNCNKPRIILDRRLRTADDSNLANSARETPVWIVTSDTHKKHKFKKLEEKGVKIILSPLSGEPKTDLIKILKHLGKLGLTRLLFEPGSQLGAALLTAGLVDQLVVFRSSSIAGNDGVGMIGNLYLSEISNMPKMVRNYGLEIEENYLEVFERPE